MYNRNAYMSVAPNMIEAANMPLAIIVGDVNDLKKMNDTLGHLCGDRLLITVAALVRGEAPEGAFAARVGGDEIVLLIPRGGEDAAKRFMKDVDSKCAAVHDKEFDSPSISWGYAIMDSADEDYNAVFARADAMMYARKQKMKEMTGVVSRSGFVLPVAALPEPSIHAHASDGSKGNASSAGEAKAGAAGSNAGKGGAKPDASHGTGKGGAKPDASHGTGNGGAKADASHGAGKGGAKADAGHSTGKAKPGTADSNAGKGKATADANDAAHGKAKADDDADDAGKDGAKADAS
jgi:diguanylate cyclase (GGDEF)-like protein